jgi:glucosamine--fructose-6-phosphate aminotransferase (isomerizing)
MSVWNDIVSQVENLQQVVGQHIQAGASAFEPAAALLRKADRIVFTGVGSGLNATIPAYHYLMANGFPADYIDATEAVYGILPGLKGAALVLNTRSGETAELIKLANLARETGIRTVTVTNETDSSVARLADEVVPTHSRWDDLVVISAYGGMLATELVLAAQVMGKFGEVAQDMSAAAESSRGVLDQVVSHRKELLGLFRDARPIYLLGRGPSIATALGGELVLEEMSRRPSVAMATGLFRQGPMEVVDEQFRAFFFGGTGEAARLSARLAADLLTRGAKVAWVGSAHLEGALNVSLPALPAHILPLLEIIPCHVLAHDLAQAQGIEPGTVRYIQKVITSEEGIPNENP